MTYRAIVLSGREPEHRNIENPAVQVSATNFLEFFGLTKGDLPAVTVDSAMTVPAFASAVAFLSRSLANLPLHAYRAKETGSERLGGKLQRVLNEAPNGEWTSFGARQYFWQCVFTRGRGLFFIERIGGNVDSLWPMDPAKTVVKRVSGKKVYVFDGKTYPAADVIDVPFMLKGDQLGVFSPLVIGRRPIQMALSMAEYGAGFFAGGGVPPLALVGPLPSGADAMKRAQADVKRAMDGAKARGEPIMPIPAGYDLKPVGFDPAKGQMTEAMRFLVEEITRIVSLPPVFVGDLTHGTFTNTEQQDLQLGKHVISHWAKALEEELNLKIFGAQNNRRYVEHSLDGLLRGDVKTRMEAYARAIQTGQLMPDEARALENRPPDPTGAGAKLYIQGATVPLGEQPTDGGANDPGNSGADVPA